MITEIQNSLRELNECGKSRTNSAKAFYHILDIKQQCLVRITDTEADYCCSLLFNNENGLLPFLRSTSNISEFKSSRDDTLKLIKDFVKKVKKKILPYVVDIKNVCSSQLLIDPSAAGKVAIVEVLVEILEIAAGSPKAEELNILDLFQNVLKKISDRLPQTVKSSMYILLGEITRIYPERVAKYSDKLLNIYVKELKLQMSSTTRKCEKAVVAGCIEGLTSYLNNFDFSPKEGPLIFKAVYESIKDELDWTRYQIPKAGLDFFAKHAVLFKSLILDYYEELFRRLEWWSNHKNSSMKKAAFSALEVVIKEIAEILAEEKKDESNGRAFTFFIKKFNSLIEKNSDSRSVAISVRCYGSFAAACKIYWSEKEVYVMFEDIMRRSEYLFSDQSESQDDKMFFLPSFIDALASIVKEMEQISDFFLNSLKRLMILLLDSYPYQAETLSFTYVKSIVKVSLSLSSKGTILRSFLSEIIFQGITRTCSHPTALSYESETSNVYLTEKNIKRPTYEDYLPLWKGILNEADIKKYYGLGFTSSDLKVLREQFYDCIINTILKILKKLDLKTDKAVASSESIPSEETVAVLSSNPVTGLQASCPDDIHVFINLVDFSRDLLEESHNYYFKKWVFVFGYDVINLANKFPFVSGLYKLMTLVFKICTKINYFQEKPDDTMDEEITSTDKDRSSAHVLFIKFIKEVLVALKQYKDELLASCLLFVLVLPVQFVEKNMAALVPALMLAFELGLSYTPLASAGLEALSTWTSQLPSHVWQPYLKEILPALDAYLKTSKDQGEGEDPTKTFKTTKRDQIRNKMAIGENLTQLQILKKKIVILLGKLGGKNNLHLINNNPEYIAKIAVGWSRENVLKFLVPFTDMKPVIFLDPFLPRIVELATSSSDRRAKVAACELFHSLVIYLLGARYAVMPGPKSIICMQILFDKIFPIVLKLACDVEEISKQLFEPLVFQLIHWFTSNKDYESNETAALLNAILDAIVNPSNPGLRDFSGRALKEFLLWSIKHTQLQKENSPVNAKSVLKRLYSLASHPNVFKRLGAAFAFNNIYTVLREDESLISIFALEILANYIECLALAHGDDKSCGTSRQCQEALDHVERILREKANIFNEKKPKRRFKDDEEPTLAGALKWLLQQTGRPEMDCRSKCRDLIEILATYVKDVKSAVNYFTRLKKQGPGFFIKRFEGGGILEDSKGLLSCPTLPEITDSFTLKAVMSWFDYLLASLDCYTWVFGKCFLNPSDIFSFKSSPSKFFESLVFFLKTLACTDIIAAYNCFKNKADMPVFTPKETDEYNRVKCIIIVRTMNFIQVLLRNHSKEIKVIPSAFWSNALWDMIIDCVIYPQSISFDMGDVLVMTNLPKETLETLQILQKYLPDNHKHDFKKYIRNKLTKSTCDLESILNSWAENGIDHVHENFLISGYQQLQSTGFLEKSLSSDKLIHTVMNNICKQDEDNVKSETLQPATHILLEKLLSLAFQLDSNWQVVIGILLDSAPLVSDYGDCNSYRGLNFFHNFSNTISQFLIETKHKSLPKLMSHMETKSSIVIPIINGVLDYLAKDSKFKNEHGSIVTSLILASWLQGGQDINDLSREKQTTSLTLLTKIAMIDSRPFSDASHSEFNSVFDLYLSMLTSFHTNLAFKALLLDLLFLFTELPSDPLDKLKSHLNKFITDNFPVSSSEYATGSAKAKDYLLAVSKLLISMEISGSLLLFELMMSIFCQESLQYFEKEINPKLCGFIKKLSQTKQEEALTIPFQLFQKSSYLLRFRQVAVERILINALLVSHNDTFIRFFQKNIKIIMTFLGNKLGKVPENERESILVSKICCYKLLELLFIRLDDKFVSSSDSVINKAYCDDKSGLKGTEFVKDVLTIAHNDKKEDVTDETSLLELRRQFHCAAYNTLAAAIICTQKDEKYYVSFLFSEKLTKCQFLWDNLIDKNKEYKFEIELSAPLEKKARLVAIRQSAHERAKRDESRNDSGFSTMSLQYLSSQYLTGSSLSEDLHHFDLSNGPQTMLLSQSNWSERRKESKSVENEQPKSYGDYIKLEDDELNQNECMANVIGLIKHMAKNIMPKLSNDAVVTEMPQWMNNFCSKFKDSTTHVNVKIFIARIIMNLQEVFHPYAKFWLIHFIQLIVSGEIGNNINYFISGILEMVLAWHDVAIPEDNMNDRMMASRLLEFAMKNTNHPNAAVYRNNKLIVMAITECWKNRLEIPYRIIFDNLKEIDLNKTDNRVGIELLDIALVNGFPPFNPFPGIDRDRFFQVLARNLKFSKKTVYASVAEVLGKILKYLAEKEKITDSGLHEEMTTILCDSKIEKSQFITCAKQISLHYPVFIDRFMTRLLFNLPHIYGTFKIYCLEMIQSRVEHIPDIFLELKSKGLTNMLSHRDDETQLVTLRIVNGMLRQLKAEELLHILASISPNIKHPRKECREVAYEIFMWIYDNYRNDEADNSKEIMKQCKDCLLYGLIEDDKVLRLNILCFWSNESRLPFGVIERLQRIVEQLYSHSTKENFLNYSSYLLLELTSKSTDYNRKIFEHPLSECKFQEYNLKTSWRSAHASMRPLFVETQMSHSEIGSSLGSYAGISGQIRATQDVLQFAPTQSTATSGTDSRDWVTQSSSFNDEGGHFGSASASAMRFNPALGQKRTTNTYKAVGPNFGQDRLSRTEDMEVDDAVIDWKTEPRHFRSWFVKDPQKETKFFIQKAQFMNKRTTERQKEQLAKREAQVTMYRKYRIGELPDIEINNSAIIAPLQALAQRDDLLAVMLMSSLSCAILKEMNELKTKHEVTQVMTTIQDSLNNILKQTIDYSPSVVCCVESIAYECANKLHLEPAAVSSASQKSKQENMGIVLLEQYLRKGNVGEEEPPRKRIRTNQIVTPPETATWIELSRLYKSLGEYDVLRGIFESKIGTKVVTQKALEAEVKGDYLKARRLYSKALKSENWPDGNPDSSEVDFWEESRLKCCDYLTEWTNLAELTNIENIWEMEIYLPYFMRCKVKLLITGHSDDDEFINFINSAMHHPERKEILQNQYCESLALLYISQEDYGRARYYSDMSMKRFLEEWSAMSELIQTNRQTKLQTLQKLTELQEFVDFMQIESNFNSFQPADNLLSTWLHRLPDPVADPMFIWEDIITNRLLFFKLIENKLKNLVDSDDKNLQRFEEVDLKLKLAFIESAREHSSFDITSKLLKETEKKIVVYSNKEMEILWNHSFVETQLKKTAISEDSPQSCEIITGLEQLVKLNNCPLLSENLFLASRHQLLQGKEIAALRKLKNLTDVDVKKLADLRVLQNHEAMCEELDASAFTCFNQAVHLAEKGSAGASSVKWEKQLCDAYLQIVHFCDDILREKDDDVVATSRSSSYSQTVIEALLKAIKNNSQEGRQQFPRLLQIVADEPNLVVKFKSLTEQIPCWMFLEWISQMVALLDKPEGEAVEDILWRIANQYPQALIYPLKLSCENYCFDGNTKNNKRVKKLLDALSPLSVIDDFITALDQLSNPLFLFKDSLNELKRCLRKQNRNDFIRNFTNMFKEVFTSTQSEREKTYRQKFIGKFAKMVEDQCGSDGSKLYNSQNPSLTLEKIQGKLDPGEEPGNLKEYSRWFSNFQASKLPIEIEIPGQYSGKTKPLPEYHIKIAGFEDQVITLQSMRKPKAITIRGNDEKNHKYIVKGGEDLRLDQRIQQLFSIMNGIFLKDALCNSLKLKIVTYKVIPLTSKLGLIEWIAKTEVFGDFIKNGAEDQTTYTSNFQKARLCHREWLKQFSCNICKPTGHNLPPDIYCYLHSYKKKPQKDAFIHYKEMVNKVPEDLLRKALLGMSLSSEAWLSLRKQFILSHAVICIAHYILGIGDRHLSNFMVSLETGSMIGIDFGHAFGTATQFLLVPELMPFRLTSQIQNLLKPLEKSGLLQNTMIHTMRALRQNHHLLLMTMDVFIKEPSLDWQELSHKQQQAGTAAADAGSDAAWYPKQQVFHARQKLEGTNPGKIIGHELQLSANTHKVHGKECTLKEMLAVCKGEPSKNIRAEMGDYLTVEQQITFLLDQATDPNILARTWEGWCPWM